MSATQDIARANTAMRRAADQMAKALEARAVERMYAIAKRNPTKQISFTSAMGTWGLSVEGDEEVWREKDPINRVFEDSQHEWGWSVIPAPISLTLEDGKLTRKTNW